MIVVFEFVTGAALLAWTCLLLFRGGYWRTRERLGDSPAPESWPDVIAIIPARNEADVIARTIRSVVGQDYAGKLQVILVDDQSSDETGELARAAVEGSGNFTIVKAEARREGWAPKVWAMQQGYEQALKQAPNARYAWLTDADVEHEPEVLSQLVAKAEAESLDQVSLMVELAVASPWERLLIPAFVLFFQKLYPFAWANDPKRRTAAAAGGCILASQEALRDIGGLVAIRDALIDDCALARELKRAAHDRNRGTWLGLATKSRSARAYGGLRGVGKMVARSAYTQLDYSPSKLLGTVVGMALLYLVPPLAVLGYPLHLEPVVLWLGALAWGLMAFSMLPVLRLYGQPLVLSLALPVAGLLYTLMTLDSALCHLRGRGSTWKGRDLAASGPVGR